MSVREEVRFVRGVGESQWRSSRGIRVPVYVR